MLLAPLRFFLWTSLLIFLASLLLTNNFKSYADFISLIKTNRNTVYIIFNKKKFKIPVPVLQSTKQMYILTVSKECLVH